VNRWQMDIFRSANIVELRPGRRVRVFHHIAASGGSAAKAAILFCHGSMASMLQYRANIEYAMNRGDLDILAYDWLGCGGSEKPRDWDAYSTSELLLDLEAAYCHLLRAGPKGIPSILVGHSFGTSLVTQFDAELRAAAAADIFESSDSALLPPPAALCLISPSDGENLGAALAVFRLPEFALRALQPSMNDSFATAALHPSTSESIRREMMSISEANEMHVCKAFYRQISWRDSEVAKAAGPALCISGDADGLISVDDARKAAMQLGQAAFHVIGPASHQVMAEQAEATNSLLAKLIDNVIAGEDALHGLDRLPDS